MTDHSIWPAFTYDDADAARAWLTALGFTEGIRVPADRNPDLVRHSEMLWPEGGRVMVSSRALGSEHATARGAQGVYVVCGDPDAVRARAGRLGAEVVHELADADYGSRGFTVRDREGNMWSFGTYAGS
ncbi:VOC family protein [Cumulibacter manganitolerans]|uniref:VOC family protein n=1 Tax=Cumulibacter manganitolerans TaxID=1884992 RepID=UPI001295B335|nr:VOC family protein [Cumulibacter manganitolerans]